MEAARRAVCGLGRLRVEALGWGGLVGPRGGAAQRKNAEICRGGGPSLWLGSPRAPLCWGPLRGVWMVARGRS